MTLLTKSITSASSATHSWNAVKWCQVKKNVNRLQMRIAKATREGRYGKVKALQWLLTHSFYPKLLAVRRIVQNRGGKTPGIDNVVWKTAQQKMEAALSLKRRGYRTKPLKIYIPKKGNTQKLRPLSIPTMHCRGMQALHLLALEPVVEMKADKNSYGFRPKRSAADAIGQCFLRLATKTSAQYILEGDIKSCFDRISQEWLMNHIIIDRDMLKKWLEAGYIDDKGLLNPTNLGVPQGSPISPTILNATLSGLEQAIKTHFKPSDKVHLVVYADDFIITAANKETLENQVKPLVERFLGERGLELSLEKTKITHIHEGFNFLGHNIRKYRNKLLIKPSKESTKSFITKVRECIKKNCSAKTENLIQQLNPMIIGWTNYFRHVVAKETFTSIDKDIFKALRKWIKQRHPNKSIQWRRTKYFRSQGLQHWIFYARTKTKDRIDINLDLQQASKVSIKRHVKVRAEATPYDPAYKEYFIERSKKRQVLGTGPSDGFIKA